MNFLNKIRRIISFRTSGKEVSYEEAIDIMCKTPRVTLIDVRSEQEYKEGHLPGAISIPVYDLASNIGKTVMCRDDVIILYCQMGARSKRAAKILADLCYTNVYVIKGGLEG